LITTNSEQIKLILLDLGGVLVELGDELFPSSWFSEGKAFGLKEWFSSETALEFETGLISTEKFISELKRSLDLTASYKEIFTAFQKWPKGLFPSSNELIHRLKADYEVAVLSNSNEIHEAILMQEFGLERQIDNIFFSHLIGCSKPHKAAFQHVLATLKFEPNEVIFFDDNSTNVLAARSIGMQAYQAFSPKDVSKHLAAQNNSF